MKTTTTTTTTELCPQCKGTGDAYKYKYRGYKRYWFPCPVCKGGKKAPDMKRYDEWLTEDNIRNPLVPDGFIMVDKFGCFYDPKEKSTYPANIDHTPDLNGGGHIDDIECEERDDIIAEINRLTGEKNK